MTRGEDFKEKAKSKNGQCSPLSTSACCDLNADGSVLKLHVKCPNSICKCRKQVTFTAKHLHF